MSSIMNRIGLHRIGVALALVGISLSLSACGYNHHSDT